MTKRMVSGLPPSRNRRRLLQGMAAWPLAGAAVAAPSPAPFTRVRPGEPGWPSAQAWQQLAARVRGALVPVRSPWAACAAAPAGPVCARLFQQAKNPFFLGDEVGLTQTLGWVDAWQSSPSA